MEKILLYYSLKYNGDFDEIFKALKECEEIDEKLKSKLFDELSNSHCNYTTLVSKDYPNKLKLISCPPFVVFYYGDLSLIDKKTVAVAGSLNPSEYGKRCTELYVNELSKKDNVIVTGMQKGVGSIALKQTIEINNNAIAVLPCGINNYYPKENKDLYDILCNRGLVLSEYPYSLEVKNDNTYKRLRLISGISDTVLLTETETNSPQLAIVQFALEQGKKVCAIPSDITNEMMQGNNELIKMGADLVTSIEDICKDDIVNAYEHDDIEMEL